MHAVARSRGDQRALFRRAAARVDHPVRTLRLPHRRFAQSVLVGRVAACFRNAEHRARAELRPVDAVTRSRKADLLLPRAILAQIIQVKNRSNADHVRVGDRALIPTCARPETEHRLRLFAPGMPVGRPRQSNLRRTFRTRLIPIPPRCAVIESAPVGRDVAAFPRLRVGR